MGWHDEFRSAFPQLAHFDAAGLVYGDSAATTLKPRVFLDTLRDAYEQLNANVHRGAYSLSREVSDAYDTAKRDIVTRFDLSPSEYDVIVTRNATEALNLASHLATRLYPDAMRVGSIAEHHSNILPWRERGGHRLCSFTSDGDLDEACVDDAIVSMTGMTNTTGHAPRILRVHRRARMMIVDAAQSASSLSLPRVDMIALSAHKVYASQGVGMLLIRRRLVDELVEKDIPPLVPGGGTVARVDAVSHAYRADALRFEGGTPPIVEVIAFARTLAWLERYKHRLAVHEKRLARVVDEAIGTLPNDAYALTLPWDRSRGIVSLWHTRLHAHDIAHFLEKDGFMVRAGWHCAQPFHEALHARATVRFSSGAYTREDDILRFFDAYQRVVKRYA